MHLKNRQNKSMLLEGKEWLPGCEVWEMSSSENEGRFWATSNSVFILEQITQMC
jgi:hypothetical protein